MSAPPTSLPCNATVANWLWFCSASSAAAFSNLVFLCDAPSQSWVFVDDLGSTSTAGASGATGATGALGPTGAPGVSDGGHGVVLGNCSGLPPASSRCDSNSVGVVFVCLDGTRQTYGCRSSGSRRIGARQSACTPAQPCWTYTGSLAIPVSDPDYLLWCIILGVVVGLCLATVILMIVYQLWLRHKHKEMVEQVNNLEVNKSVVVLNNTSSAASVAADAAVSGAAAGRMRGRDRRRSLVLENDKVVRRDSGMEDRVSENVRRLQQVGASSMDLDRMMLEQEGADYVDTSAPRQERSWSASAPSFKGKDQMVHNDPYANDKGKEEAVVGEEGAAQPKPQFIFETRGIGAGRPGVEGAGRGRGGSAVVKGRGRGLVAQEPRFATMLRQELAAVQKEVDTSEPRRLSSQNEADLRLAAALSNTPEEGSEAVSVPVAVVRNGGGGPKMSAAALEQLERDKRALAGVSSDAFEARGKDEEVVIPVAARPKSFLAKKDQGQSDVVYNNPYRE